MNRGTCANCGEPLPAWSRADRLTCSVRCRVARQRRAAAAKPRPVVVRATPASDDVAKGVTGVTSVSAQSGPGEDLATVTDEGALIRLSSWLAEVSADTALAAAAEREAS